MDNELNQNETSEESVNMNESVQAESMESIEATPEKSGGVGPVIGSIIVIIVIVLGGLYYLNSVKVDIAKEEAPALNESSEIEAIEEDLNQTDLDNLDAEFSDIEAEIDAALAE